LKARGSTILVSTPYMDEVALSDRAAFVYGGRVLGEGTPGQLVKRFRGRVYRMEAPLAAGTFDRLAAIRELGARRFGSAVYFYTGPGKSFADFHERLAALGIRAEMTTEVEPSLEDAFIDLMAMGAAQ